MNVTLTTFNVENLFNRHALLDEPWDGRGYEKVVLAYDIASIASRDDDLVSYETTHLTLNNYASDKSVSRLDYILPHKRLALSGAPVITRNGLSTKCKQYTGPRFPTIGPEHTEASDHCPLSMTFSV